MRIITASIRTILVLIIISLSFIGSDCNDIIENLGNSCTGNQVDLIGKWKFTQNLGGVRDICFGEIVEFTTGGSALLTCPNQGTLTRNYTQSSNVLTYTETGVKYCITGDTDELQLTGINNNRIIYYVKVISDENSSKQKQSDNNILTNNSSEITK